MKNTYGDCLSLTLFGESHGAAIGAVLDGMAAGVPVDEQAVAACMDRRRARESWTAGAPALSPAPAGSQSAAE